MHEGVSDDEAIEIVRRLQGPGGPDFFIDEVLGFAGTPLEHDEQQRAILRDLACHDMVGVCAANGAGKSYTCATAGLWFRNSFFPSRVISTAGTWEQVKSKLWLANIHKIYHASKTPLGGRLNDLDLTLRDPESNEVLSYMLGQSTKYPEYFEGHHEDNILIIVDEAKAVPKCIFDAIDRCRSTGIVVKLLVASTPGADAGPFYDIITDGEDLGWHIHRIKATRSKRIRRSWIKEMLRKHGRHSPFFRSSVMALFPTSSPETVCITRLMLEMAARRSAEEVPADAPVDVGIDIADTGDNWTRIVMRRANHVFRAYGYQGYDTMRTAGEIVKIIRSGVDPQRIRVDHVGLGKGTYDRVREQGYPIVGVNYGAASTTKGKPNEQQFANLGAELWWTVRRKLLGEVGAGDPIILEPEVAKDIEGDCVGREWTTTSDGKIKLESKEDMLARGLKSPDYGDALTLSFAPIRLTPRVKFPKRKAPGSPWARGGRRTFARAEM